MPDSDAARWKERYERAQAAYQERQSEVARLEARLEAVLSGAAAPTDDVVKAERAAAKADREATRKRRFLERVRAQALRDSKA